MSRNAAPCRIGLVGVTSAFLPSERPGAVPGDGTLADLVDAIPGYPR